MCLELTNVTKRYSPASSPVLRDVRLTVNAGEFVCIVGYSGSGKTTLINLIAGLIKLDEGQIKLEGRAVTGPNLDCALIFQNYSLLPWLTVLRNVELAVTQTNPSASRSAVTTHAMHYLRLVKLEHAVSRRPAELSGGMRQRVALARGLAMKPKILLLDEPLGALDALTRSELQDELLRIRQDEKCTVLMITNDIDEAIFLADRIVPMSAGPEATLGESIDVTITRPCRRRDLNFDPSYQHTRKAVIRYLMGHCPSRSKNLAGNDSPLLGGRCSQENNQSGAYSPATVWRDENGASSLATL